MHSNKEVMQHPTDSQDRRRVAHLIVVMLLSSGKIRHPAYTSVVSLKSWNVTSVTIPNTVPAPFKPLSSS